MNSWLCLIIALAVAGVCFYFAWFFHHITKLRIRNDVHKHDMPEVLRGVAIAGVALFFGLFAALYAISVLTHQFSGIETHARHIAQPEQSRQHTVPQPQGMASTADDFSMLLGVLGIIMTLATVAVINLARNAVEDMRFARDEIDHKYQSLEQENTWADVQYKRLQLIHENEKERLAAELSGNSARVFFRDSLSTFYESAAVDQISGYLMFLEENYQQGKYGHLLCTEREYLNDLQRYFSKYGRSPEEHMLASRAKAVIRLCNA